MGKKRLNKIKVPKGENLNVNAQYFAERRVIQVLDFLKRETDETHDITQDKLLDLMLESKDALTQNELTLSKTIDQILLQINPEEYEGHEDEYRIIYKDYKKGNLVEKKVEIQERRKAEAKKRKELKEQNRLHEYVKPRIEKAPAITNLKFVHDFSNHELNQLMEAVNTSGRLSVKDKTNLMEKLQRTASKYFSSPFYDKEKKKLQFNQNGIYSRLESGKFASGNDLVSNLEIIQRAIKKNVQIEYYFNRYTVNGELKPSSTYKRWISPYHIIVYHDLYYLLGVMDGKDTVSHIRIDLMTEVGIKTSADGRPLKAMPRSKTEFAEWKGWNPEKYAAQHLNMFYGKPERIQIKIKKGQATTLFTWFGNHFKQIESAEEYDVVEVEAVPDAMVYWALQYSDTVEILSQNVRDKIKEIINKDLKEKYFD